MLKLYIGLYTKVSISDDDARLGWPCTTKTDENIIRVKQLVLSDDKLTV